jgi:hypothetical protein
MSGVVDENGQQWEHCYTCDKFVRFPQDLGYTAGYAAHICLQCTNALPQDELKAVIPAPNWVPNYEEEGEECATSST